jgi:hypothetical protein
MCISTDRNPFDGANPISSVASGSQNANAIAPAAIVHTMWISEFRNPLFSQIHVIPSNSSNAAMFMIMSSAPSRLLAVGRHPAKGRPAPQHPAAGRLPNCSTRFGRPAQATGSGFFAAPPPLFGGGFFVCEIRWTSSMLVSPSIAFSRADCWMLGSFRFRISFRRAVQSCAMISFRSASPIGYTSNTPI